MAKAQRLTPSRRFSNTTPEGLRKRILSAIPDWEKIPRKHRQALSMLPVYGTWADACEAIGTIAIHQDTPIGKKLKEIVWHWVRTGEYPLHHRTYEKRKRGEKREEVTVSVPVTQAEILQQLANEMAAIALIKAESSMTPAAAAKLAEQSGWFLNIEAEVEKARAYTDQRIGKMLDGMNNNKPPADEGPSIPEFEADQEVDDDFDGSTEAATEGSKPADSATVQHQPEEPEPGAVV